MGKLQMQKMVGTLALVALVLQSVPRDASTDPETELWQCS